MDTTGQYSFRTFRSLSAVLALASTMACNASQEQDLLPQGEPEGSVQRASGSTPPPLSAIPVPRPSGGDIVDMAAAVRLGKALFWDVQAGGDGQTACASCHFKAGADNRMRNTIHPGPNGTFQAVSGPDQLFSGKAITSDDVMGSQGVAQATFQAISSDPTVAADLCTPVSSPQFGSFRQVTGRNSPTVIGAVFYRDNFWDGRANHRFNGLDPFGATGNAQGGLTALENSSLASQAVGPANDHVEMACAGRPFNGANSLGAKLLTRQPLRLQQVSPTDSVLGALSAAPADGMKCGGLPCTYRDLVAAAFGPDMARDAEARFSSIWGQAIQAYEATLIPNDTPFDRFLAGNQNAMTDKQKRGWDRFQGKGSCAKCHAGSELSDATVSFAAAEGLINEDGGDQGFHNIGVRPTAEDLGRASIGPGGVPFSVSRARADRGAFKTPGLRNVKLTAPYFHNGGKATLAEVVDLYARGGDFKNPELATRVQPLSLDSDDRAALVAFMAEALTDCRVEKDRAPFDHPSLGLPNGSTLPAVGAAGLGPCP